MNVINQTIILVSFYSESAYSVIKKFAVSQYSDERPSTAAIFIQTIHWLLCINGCHEGKCQLKLWCGIKCLYLCKTLRQGFDRIAMQIKPAGQVQKVHEAAILSL